MKRFPTLMLVFFLFGSLAQAKIAPNFKGKTLQGKKLSLKSSLKPNRGLLVCFWATWCSPCIEEMRKLTAELKANPELNLDIVTVNVDASETFAEVKPTVKALKIPFPVVLDGSQKIFSKYQTEQTLPYSVLVGPNRMILQEFNGLHDDMLQVLDRKLTPLRKGQKVEKKTS